MYQGGISRASTFRLIDRDHGRTSSYVTSDIGAIAPGRWQLWQLRCRIGSTSFVKVTSPPAPAACAGADAAPASSSPATAFPSIRNVWTPSHPLVTSHLPPKGNPRKATV